MARPGGETAQAPALHVAPPVPDPAAASGGLRGHPSGRQGGQRLRTHPQQVNRRPAEGRDLRLAVDPPLCGAEDPPRRRHRKSGTPQWPPVIPLDQGATIHHQRNTGQFNCCLHPFQLI